MDFLSKRLEQVKSRRAAAAEQETQRAARTETLKQHITLLKDLLRDPRYATYTALLRDTKRSCEQEREAVLQTESDQERREHQVLLLTGRILQLEWILTTPDSFLALADLGEPAPGEGRPKVPDHHAARSPARESGR